MQTIVTNEGYILELKDRLLAANDRISVLNEEVGQARAAVEKLLDSFDYMNSNCRDCTFENPCCQYGDGEDCCRAAAERWAYQA
jgi:hypothetical protein